MALFQKGWGPRTLSADVTLGHSPQRNHSAGTGEAEKAFGSYCWICRKATFRKEGSMLIHLSSTDETGNSRNNGPGKRDSQGEEQNQTTEGKKHHLTVNSSISGI